MDARRRPSFDHFGDDLEYDDGAHVGLLSGRSDRDNHQDGTTRAPGLFQRLMVLSWYTGCQLWHGLPRVVLSWILTTAWLVPLVALYGAIETITGSAGDDVVDNAAILQNRSGVIFFIVSAVFLASTNSHGRARQELAVYRYYACRGYYSPLVFWLHQLIAAAATRGAFFGLLFGINHAVAGSSIRGDAVAFVGALAMTSMVAELMVQVGTCLSPQSNLSTLLVVLMYAFSAPLGGLFLNIASMPPVVRSLSFGGVIRLGYEISLVAEFDGAAMGCSSSGAPMTITTTTARASVAPVTVTTSRENFTSTLTLASTPSASSSSDTTTIIFTGTTTAFTTVSVATPTCVTAATASTSEPTTTTTTQGNNNNNTHSSETSADGDASDGVGLQLGLTPAPDGDCLTGSMYVAASGMSRANVRMDFALLGAGAAVLALLQYVTLRFMN
jgi:hypothetical protein